MGHGLRDASRGTSSLELLVLSLSKAKPASTARASLKAEGRSCLYVKKLSVCRGKVGAKNIWVGAQAASSVYISSAKLSVWD